MTNKIFQKSLIKRYLDAINETIELTDKGVVRVANKNNNSWM